MNQKHLQIREATIADALRLRGLRLEALKGHPEAFGADYETDKNLPLTIWEKSLESNPTGTVFIAESDSDLVGTAGIKRFASTKMFHVALIWGVYVSAEYRREKLGEKLINACFDWARQKNLMSVKLAVAATNTSAIRLYVKCGFEVYGVDPKVIKANGIFYDELLMVRNL
ncbi:MAG TPA: GNAT family N-acetyltransferase [Pyrinomonadaceae bacterium]|jgi:ribosomal protein S18 acetylase RimI-like enzyme